jgi:outer membrane protein assembly factor BamB
MGILLTVRIAVIVLVGVAAALSAQSPPLEVLWKVPLRSNSYGGAAVADVDGDGLLEVAFGTYFGDSRVLVLNGEDGSELWSHDAGRACLDASVRFGDVNGDGRLDLVVPVSNTCRVHAFEAATGKIQWTYETGDGDCIDSPPALVDLNGDGFPELVFGSFRNRLHVVDGPTGKRVRLLDVGTGFIQTGPVVMDLDGDEVADFVAGTFKGDNRLWALSGRTGEPLWHHEVGKGIGIYHGPAVGDLDGDGIPELVQTAYDGVVRCLRSKDGKVLWSLNPGERYYMSPAAIADLDGDGKLEVIAVSSRVTVIESDGEVRYSKRIAAGWGGAHRGASIADLDGDGNLDIAYLLDNGSFGVRRGRDGELLYELAASRITDQTVASNANGPVLADLDGDGFLDAFYVVGRGQSSGSDANFGVAVCVTGFRGRGPGWPMLRHDAHNSGNFHTAQSEALQSALSGIAKKGGSPAEDLEGPAPAPPVAARSAALDWTLGTWEGTRRDGADGTEAAMTMKVERVLGGVGQTQHVEVQHKGGTYRGLALQVFDPARDSWSRVYVNDARRSFVRLQGEIDGERSVWRPLEPNPDRLSRMVSERLGEDTWRRTMSVSNDDGRTWSVLWQDELRRPASPSKAK